MPPNTFYVGRPTRYGNPYTIGLRNCGCRSAGECTHNLLRVTDAAEAVEAYSEWVKMWRPERLREAVAELRGKDLVCWCPLDQPCHADVLLELANARL